MSWAPSDLVTDRDLVAYERTILTQFGATEWQAKREKAIEDWLWPLVSSVGLDPHRFRTRYQPAAVYGSTSSVFTDYTAAARSTTTDDLSLAPLFAAGSDALYIGAPWPFHGLSLRMLDAVSAVAATLTVEAWCDRWTAVLSTDGTQATAGVPFGRGGAITWAVPSEWVTRSVNGSAAFYWARLRLSAVPTSAKLGQVSVIRRSALCAAVTLKTLAQVFHEAPTQQDGPWEAKATYYGTAADEAWQRVQPLLGREFDTVTVDDTIDVTEAQQTTADASGGGGWSWDRA